MFFSGIGRASSIMRLTTLTIQQGSKRATYELQNYVEFINVGEKRITSIGADLVPIAAV